MEVANRPYLPFPGFLDKLPLIAIMLDREGKVTYCNRSFELISGWSRREATGRNWFATFIPEEERQEVRDVFDKAVHWGEVVGTYRNEILTRGGERRLIAWNNTELRDPAGKQSGVVSFGEDITEREAANRKLDRYACELRHLSRKLLEAQEAERRCIAQELHDEIGQSLTVLKLNLDSLRKDGQPLSGNLSNALAIADDIGQRIQKLCLDLRPTILDDLGLLPALRWYLNRLARNSTLGIHYCADPSIGRLPPTVETACFRVAQEAMTNSARHARARHLSVALEQKHQRLQLTVRDDGIGFDVPETRRRSAECPTVGLLGMQERVSLVGGTLEIRSRIGCGTELEACFPLQGIVATD